MSDAITGKGLTFGRFLDSLAHRFGDRPAIVARDRSAGRASPLRRTYRELAEEVSALQSGLTEFGVEPGERVAVLLSSFPEWIVYLFAVTRLGAVFVPLNPRFGSHELDYVLRHSGSATLVAMGHYLGRDYAATIAEVSGHWVPGRGASKVPALRRLIGVRSLPHPAAVDTGELLARGRSRLATAGVPPAARDVEAPAILFYTSGTTAFPKGVSLTHANLLPHSIRCGMLLDLRPADRVLTLYPFFGISGGANKVLSTFGAGACLVFQDAFRAEEAYELLEAEGCTVIHGVDAQIRELVQVARSRGTPPRDRRGTIAFVAGLDEALAREMGDVLGLRRFVHPYGMTEVNPMVLRNELDDPFEARLRPGGRVAPGVEIRIVDPESGGERPVGTPGEIVARGETVTRGYFQDPEATAAACRDGWFHTGDLGVRTPEGFVFYLGRLKDMLKVGGFNVSPQEVETFLRTHQAVEDVAVAGAPDRRLGEVVVAFVKPRQGHPVSEAGLQDYCRGHIANFKVPHRIYLVEELPYHTAAHGAKLQRAVLREWASQRTLESSSQARAASAGDGGDRVP